MARVLVIGDCHCPGRLQFEYGHRIAAKPMLGCGIVLHGCRAFFEPWLLKSR
jgi:hypothetical protein